MCSCNSSGAFQLFQRQSKVVHAGEEQERFSLLTFDYMSEESSSDGGETNDCASATMALQ